MTLLISDCAVSHRVLDHLLERIECTHALDEPFSHIYLEEVFPGDLYERLLEHLPDLEEYDATNQRYQSGEASGGFVRLAYPITPDALSRLGEEGRELWSEVAAALTATELKRALFEKLSRDLAYRYGVAESRAGDLPGYARPTLYRETAGFEIRPHPDTRKKVVTMHLYLPADRTQLDLGTALYRRKLLGSPFGGWRNRFEKVKQFSFQPNSGYAFVVNNTPTRKSWHGREKLRAGAGVRNTLLNTYYETPLDGFCGYLT
jgi:hypothetical protein